MKMVLQVDDLMMKGLVKPRDFIAYNQELTLLKYQSTVFYNNLWHMDERLLECRGSIVDGLGNIVVLPFRKVFNIGENKTEIDDDRPVTCVCKMNGFMAAYTNTPWGPLISTTGSIDSDHVEMAREILDTYDLPDKKGVTYLFEICHHKDPHIVKEKVGAYLIGMRWHLDGSLSSEVALDIHAHKGKFLRPQWSNTTFGQVRRAAKVAKHEGFMIRDIATGKHLAKLKTPHYLTKKAIMRLGKARVDGMFQDPETFKQRIDEEFYDCVDFIVDKFSSYEWKLMNDQARRKCIENYFKAV